MIKKHFRFYDRYLYYETSAWRYVIVTRSGDIVYRSNNARVCYEKVTLLLRMTELDVYVFEYSGNKRSAWNYIGVGGLVKAMRE